MSVTDGILLGIVQGLTEFLPISSTGHLILARAFFDISSDFGLAIDAVLQLATALAVLVYFRREFSQVLRNAVEVVVGWFTPRPEISAEDRGFLLALIVGTIPAVVAGLFLEETMETVFRSTALVAGSLVAGSVLLLVGEYVLKRNPREVRVTPRSGFLIGCFQALALIPGMSRSGSTIAGGMIVGLSRERAARFAFMLSFPIILGSGLAKLIELVASGFIAAIGVSLLAGAAASFVVGMLSIHYLLKYVRNHSLLVFVLYRVVLAIVVFVLL